jgi:hypothetical protein
VKGLGFRFFFSVLLLIQPFSPVRIYHVEEEVDMIMTDQNVCGIRGQQHTRSRASSDDHADKLEYQYVIHPLLYISR